jgi:hypothetical protein
MIKLFHNITIQICCIIAIIIVQGCQSDAVGITPDTSNSKLKKSYQYIVQDNANGRINKLSNEEEGYNREYIYDDSGKLINELFYFRLSPTTINLYYHRYFVYHSTYIEIKEKSYAFGSIWANPTSFFSIPGSDVIYNVYFNTNKRIDSIVSNTVVFEYNYKENNQLNAIQIYNNYGILAACVRNFTYSNNNITNYDYIIYNSWNTTPDSTHHTLLYEYSIGNIDNEQYSIHSNNFLTHNTFFSNNVNLLQIAGLNFGLKPNALPTKLISSLIGNTEKEISNISYILDDSNRIINTFYINQVCMDTSGVFSYTY